MKLQCWSHRIAVNEGSRRASLGFNSFYKQDYSTYKRVCVYGDGVGCAVQSLAFGIGVVGSKIYVMALEMAA